MANFWRKVNEVIRDADVLLEVVDARLVDLTRNEEIETKIERAGKKLIIVANKCDLISKEEAERIKKSIKNSIFMSAKDKEGTKKLKEAIFKTAKKDQVVVGVLGYPNTGKSSVINSLRGKAVAKTSSQSGYTRGLQKVRISKRLVLLDTPGVFPYKEQDEAKHALTGAKSVHDIKDVELAAMRLIETLDGKIEEHYGVEKKDDPEETLEEIGLKLNKLLKKGKADTKATSRVIINDWQSGKIK